MVACIGSLVKGVEDHHHEHLDYGLRSHTTAGVVFDFFNGLGTVAFAFAGHSVVLEIQATIPSSPAKPSKKPMWKGAVVAYIIVAICYFSVAFAGYWAFGSQVQDDVLVSLRKPAWIISFANFMVFLHVIGGYQVRNLLFPSFSVLKSESDSIKCCFFWIFTQPHIENLY